MFKHNVLNNECQTCLKHILTINVIFKLILIYVLNYIKTLFKTKN